MCCVIEVNILVIGCVINGPETLSESDYMYDINLGRGKSLSTHHKPRIRQHITLFECTPQSNQHTHAVY